MRSRTSSLGAGVHPSLAVSAKGAAAAAAGPVERVIRSSQTSPSRTCSRASSKKSNHSTIVSNGKVGEGKFGLFSFFLIGIIFDLISFNYVLYHRLTYFKTIEITMIGRAKVMTIFFENTCLKCRANLLVSEQASRLFLVH